MNRRYYIRELLQSVDTLRLTLAPPAPDTWLRLESITFDATETLAQPDALLLKVFAKGITTPIIAVDLGTIDASGTALVCAAIGAGYSPIAHADTQPRTAPLPTIEWDSEIRIEIAGTNSVFTLTAATVCYSVRK